MANKPKLVKNNNYSFCHENCGFIHCVNLTSCLLGLSDPEDGGTTILRNVANRSPNDTESHLRRLEFSVQHKHTACIYLAGPHKFYVSNYVKTASVSNEKCTCP
jgi:hypothetical protein